MLARTTKKPMIAAASASTKMNTKIKYVTAAHALPRKAPQQPISEMRKMTPPSAITEYARGPKRTNGVTEP